MQLSRDNPEVEIKKLWKQINRHRFPTLVNEDGELNRKKLLESLAGHEVCAVIDRGKGL
jgi:hypothetical protein